MGDESQPRRRPERRFMIRYPSKAGAVVVRDSDMMRVGLEGSLKDVSVGGIGLLMDEPLQINEQVKIRLHNEVQRFEKEVRGIVRHATLREDGRYHNGVELLLRLTPLEVSLLRMGMAGESSQGPQWM